MTTALTLGFLEAHPREAARLVAQLPVRQVVEFVRETPPDTVSRFLSHLPAGTSALCMKNLDLEVAARVIEDMDVATASLILRRVRPRRRAAIMAKLSTTKSAPLQLLLDYPADTAGAVMDPMGMTLTADISAGAALRQVRMGQHKPQHYFYVLGDRHDVLGYTSLHDLFFSARHAYVGGLMRTAVTAVPARRSIASLQHSPLWREVDVLPVVNHRQTYLGLIRFAMVHGESPADVAPTEPGLEIVWQVLETAGSFVGSLLAAPTRPEPDEDKKDA